MDYLDASQDEFHVLSVGTGQQYSYIETSRGNLGYSHWLMDPGQPMALVKAVMDCNSAAVSYSCSRILRDSFFRLDPKLGESLLAAGLTPEVEARYDAIVASTDMESVVSWLDHHEWIREESKPAVAGI